MAPPRLPGQRSLGANLRLARPYLVLLATFTLGRWLQGLCGVPYDRGHHVFSIVTLTAVSCLYYGAFMRRWRGHALMQSVLLAVLLGLIAQTVILVSTLASYALDLQTYFNHPVALNTTEPMPLAQALSVRMGGMVGNSIFAGILGALGWALGGLLPEP